MVDQIGMKPLDRVRAWFARAELTDGARLPPERELARTLGLSRSDLRNALFVLEAEGRLERKVGSGTYVRHPAPSDPGEAGGLDVNALAERTGPHEAMVARLALEPELTQMAALHATPRQLGELRRLADSMREASSWRVYEELDAAFHDLIARSAGNPLLYEVFNIVNGVRMIVVWRRLSPPDAAPPPDYHSFREHEAIVTALEQRDRIGAQKAMRAHLQSTIHAMTADH